MHIDRHIVLWQAMRSRLNRTAPEKGGERPKKCGSYDDREVNPDCIKNLGLSPIAFASVDQEVKNSGKVVRFPFYENTMKTL